MHPILKSHCENGHFSHGYLLVGDRSISRASSRKAAAVLLKSGDALLDSHPDFSEKFFESFGVDEALELKQELAMKPILAEKRVFLLGVGSFAYEAANILSKILEEPPPACHFFFMVHSLEEAPLALRSKFFIIPSSNNFSLDEQKIKFYKKFLKANSAERLNLIKDAVSDKRLALEFLNELEIILHDCLKKQNRSLVSKNIILSLADIQSNRRFLFDRAPSSRMILEYFCLTLPQL